MSVLDEVICYKCKEVFGIERATRQVLLRTHQNFWCPHGHQQHYVEGESEADKLRRERDRLKQQLAQKDDDIEWQRKNRIIAERSAIAYKGQATKLRNRAKAGVCPCCNRTFKQLAQHMATQHPQFTPDVPEPVLKVVGGTES